MQTQPRYAFFDFDGTLIAEDSFVTLLRKGLKQEPWRFLLLLLFSPLLIITAFFKVDRTYAKSAILWSMTVGKTKKQAIQFLRGAVSTERDRLWFQEAVGTLENLRNEGFEIILVSASGQLWIRALLAGKYQNFRAVIGSKLGFCAGGVILKSKNCYMKEKLVRIEQMLGKNFIWQSTWSDHPADIPMFLQAQERYIICPKKKHRNLLETTLRERYEILNWTQKT